MKKRKTGKMKTKKYLTFYIGSKQINRGSLRNAITIPEFFIVFLFIAIIAAISAPKFSEAKSGNDLTSLVKSLEMVRQQLELYKVQHDGLLPGQKFKGQEIHEEDFVNGLTESGRTYGPYLKKMPKNPFNDLRSVRIGSVTIGSAAGAGWFLNCQTGDFRADDLEFHRAY
jgi:general secretion pathway protein G